MENKNQDSMPKDHVAIILEEIKSQGKVAIELHSDLSKKVDLILKDVDGIKSDVVDIKRDIKEIRSDVVEIKSDIVDVKVRLDSIDEKLVNKAEKEVTDDHETLLVNLEKTVLSAR